MILFGVEIRVDLWHIVLDGDSDVPMMRGPWTVRRECPLLLRFDAVFCRITLASCS